MNRLLDDAIAGRGENFIAASIAEADGPVSLQREQGILGWATCDIYRSRISRERDCTLINVFVAPGFRGRGIAKKLLHALVEMMGPMQERPPIVLQGISLFILGGIVPHVADVRKGPEKVAVSDLEGFIDMRLEAMHARPLMYGSAETLELEGLLLIEIFDRFVLGRDGLAASFAGHDTPAQKFRKTVFPKCPSPSMLAHWLQDKEWGLGLEEAEAARKVVEFIIALKAHTKASPTDLV